MIKYLKIARESLGKGPYRGFWLDAIFVILFFSMFVVTAIRFYKADEKIPLLLNVFANCAVSLFMVTVFFTPVLLFVRRIILGKINMPSGLFYYAGLSILMCVSGGVAYIFDYFDNFPNFTEFIIKNIRSIIPLLMVIFIFFSSILITIVIYRFIFNKQSDKG
jgi:hypothetical protein